MDTQELHSRIITSTYTNIIRKYVNKTFHLRIYHLPGVISNLKDNIFTLEASVNLKSWIDGNNDEINKYFESCKRKLGRKILKFPLQINQLRITGPVSINIEDVQCQYDIKQFSTWREKLDRDIDYDDVYTIFKITAMLSRESL